MYGAVMERERKNVTSAVRSASHSVRRENRTGIPTQLKERMERSTGLSFDDVRVHYNSALPARLDALAYTQGNQVEIGPGQERHLPHELGHVVQQKLGAVRANATHSSGVALNTDPALEHQADEIGAGKKLAIVQRMRNNSIIQRCGDEEDSPEEEEKKDESQEHSPPGSSPETGFKVDMGDSNPGGADFIVSPNGIVADAKTDVISIPKAQFTFKKLQHEFKHAGDFGVIGNCNKSKAEEYQRAIESHISSATDIFISKYRGDHVYVYYNSSTEIGVYVDFQGSYVGGWKFKPEQINYHMQYGIKLRRQ